MRIVSFILLFAWVSPTFAQIQEAPAPTPEVKPLHQIFLNEPIKDIRKIEYIDQEKGQIKYKLSDDESAIYLLDYDGSGGVKATVTDLEGNAKEITRSKCHIHDLPEL